MAMRRVFTAREAEAQGLTRSALRWGEAKGRWRKIGPGVYAEGPEPITELDRAVGSVVVAGGVASGGLAGVLLGLDSVTLDGPDLTVPPGSTRGRPGVRRRHLPPERIVQVEGVQCTDGLQTVIDLAATLDDLVWEQALESALRKRLLTVGMLESALPQLGRSRVPGTGRIRRVLRLRPPEATPTESLLETLMVQLARTVPGLPPPVRQYRVFDADGYLVARVDLAWPELGLFIELDGQQHLGQPVYDARRETAVVAATGWLCGRFTWAEVVRFPRSTARRLAALAEQARRRPLVSRDQLGSVG